MGIDLGPKGELGDEEKGPWRVSRALFSRQRWDVLGRMTGSMGGALPITSDSAWCSGSDPRRTVCSE